MGDCLDCLGRIPFASLVAFLIMSVGVGVCCGTLYRGLNILIEEVFEELFHLDCLFSWTSIFRVIFIIVSSLMGLIGLVLVIFGCLATGATRSNVYTGTKCIMGGRVTAAFFMFLTYFLNFVWILVTIVLSVPTIFLLMLFLRCSPTIEFIDMQGPETVDKEMCIRLNHFGFNINTTVLQYDGYNGQPCRYDVQEHLCRKDDIHLFCNKVGESYVYFLISMGGSILVILGLVFFIICLTANYFHISTSTEITEYRQAIDLQSRELELSYIHNTGQFNGSGQAHHSYMAGGDRYSLTDSYSDREKIHL